LKNCKKCPFREQSAEDLFSKLRSSTIPPGVLELDTSAYRGSSTH
ncbi:unnamed protein product, partial [Allacma fusca]